MAVPVSIPPERRFPTDDSGGNQEALRRYYAFHARIYDLTRWTFLFGRRRLVDRIAARFQPRRILEIGCGTGTNLGRLARQCPDAALMGWDGSRDMLERARKRLQPLGDRCRLREGFFDAGCEIEPAPDLVVVSYCLSMVNPGMEELIGAAAGALAPGGLLAVVDFHGTPWPTFRRWMRANHVRLERQLLPALRAACHPVWEEILPAWGGAWEYLLFLGQPYRHREPGSAGETACP